MKLITSFVYGVSAALLLVGVVVVVFTDLGFGELLMFLTLIFTSLYQGWVIDKLHKKLEEEKKKLKQDNNLIINK